jgi:hypothetical protein
VILKPVANVIKVVSLSLTMRPNKLDNTPQAIHSSLINYLRKRACQILEHLKGVPFRKAPALLANNILGWKGLPGTNNIAYLA